MKKKIISLLLIICMIAGMFGNYISLSNVQAEGTTEAPDFSGYDVMTLKDNNISDGSYAANVPGDPSSYRKNLDGVLYDFYVTTSGQLDLYLGGPSRGNWVGLVFQFNNGNVYIKRNGLTGNGNWQATFQTAEAKWNEEMHVWLTIDYIAADSDGTKNDIKVKVWLNEVFIGEHTYPDIANISTALGSGAMFIKGADTTYSLKSISVSERQAHYDSVEFSDFGMPSKTYTVKNVGAGSNSVFSYGRGNDFAWDGKVLDSHMQMQGSSEIRIGGTNTGYGIRLYTWQNNFNIKYVNSSGAQLFAQGFNATSDEAKLIQQGCNVKLFTKAIDSDSDGNKDDLKIAIHMKNDTGEFYGSYSVVDAMSSFTGKHINLFEVKDDAKATSILVVKDSAEEQKTPEQLGYEKIALEDFGIQSGTNSSGMWYGGYSEADTLDGKYIDMDLTLAATAVGQDNSAINFGGNNAQGWLGIRFYKTATAFCLASTNRLNQRYTWEFKYDDLGITDHTQPINIKLGAKVSGNNVVGDFWVNGVRQKQMIFAGATGQFGKYLGIFSDKVTPITVMTSEEKDFTNYKVMTLTDNAIADGNFTAAEFASAAYRWGRPGKYDSLDGVLYDFYMNTAGQTDLYLGGPSYQSWVGFVFSFRDGNIYVKRNGLSGKSGNFERTFATTKARYNEEMHVQITTDYLVLDANEEKNDVQVKVWIDDTLVAKYVYYDIQNLATALGTSSFFQVVDKKDLSLRSLSVEQKTPEALEYEKVTLEDFNLQTGTYAEAGNPIYGYYTKGSSLDGKYLDMDLTLGAEETNWGGTAINFAGSNPLGWWGLRLYKTTTGFQVVSTKTASAAGLWEVRYETLGITDHTKPVNVKLGVKLDGEDVIADLWINDVRQPQMTFPGGKEHFGNYTSVYCDGTPLTIGTPVEQITPESLGFTEIQLDKDFQIPDAVYGCDKSGDQLLVEGTYEGDDLNNTYLNADVKFAGEYTGEFTYTDAEGKEKTAAATEGGFRYAGLATSWSGIKIHVADDKLLFTNVMKGVNTASITEAQAGVDFAEEFNLKLGTKIYDIDGDDMDDIELYVWIKDVYMGKYNFTNITYKDANGKLQSAIGNVARIYMIKEGQSVEFATPGKVEVAEAILGADYTKSTFASFQLSDGTYSYETKKTVLSSGAYPFSMNKTAFIGEISFANAKDAELRIGGKKDAWHGLKFWTKNGNLYMQDATGLTKKYQFLPTVAGVDFAEDTFNLQVSIEYIDCDTDGAKDDVKLGVWFNGKLYNNTYIELSDYKQHLGKCMGIYTPKDSRGVIEIASTPGIYKGVDYTIWGFTDNWEKEIGVK